MATARRDWTRTAVKRMEASRRATLTFISRLPEEEIRRPRTFDRWSIKDLLAHVVAWEEETVRRLDLIRRGRLDRVHWFHDLVGADRFNARAVTSGRRQSLAALLRRMARVRRQLVSALRRVPHDALRDRSNHYAIVDWLPELAWTHEEDHLRELKAWWQKRRAASPFR